MLAKNAIFNNSNSILPSIQKGKIIAEFSEIAGGTFTGAINNPNNITILDKFANQKFDPNYLELDSGSGLWIFKKSIVIQVSISACVSISVSNDAIHLRSRNIANTLVRELKSSLFGVNVTTSSVLYVYSNRADSFYVSSSEVLTLGIDNNVAKNLTLTNADAIRLNHLAYCSISVIEEFTQANPSL